MTGHCKDCKWWGDGTGKGNKQEIDSRAYQPDTGIRVEYPLWPTYCGHRMVVWSKEYPYTDSDAIGYEDVDCPPVFGPMFGCVHFDPRNPPAGDGAFAYDHDIPGEKVSEK